MWSNLYTCAVACVDMCEHTHTQDIWGGAESCWLLDKKSNLSQKNVTHQRAIHVALAHKPTLPVTAQPCLLPLASVVMSTQHQNSRKPSLRRPYLRVKCHVPVTHLIGKHSEVTSVQCCGKGRGGTFGQNHQSQPQVYSSAALSTAAAVPVRREHARP